MDFQKNDLVTVTIEDMGNDGEGIGRADGFTLFVKDALVGDIVEARIVKNKKTYAYARLEKVLTPSPFRVEPKCPYHRQCGGCQLQALSYEEQIAFKQQKIRNHLIRIGGFAPEYIDARMEPIVGTEYPFRYRNKAQYPVGTDRNGHIVTGFYAGRTHSIIANTDCFLGAEENRQILEIILKHMEEYRISAYDETTGKGLVRHILIRKSFFSGELMVCLVLNKIVTDMSDIKNSTNTSNREYPNRGLVSYKFIREQDVLLQKLSEIKGMTSVSVSLNSQQTNVIMGKEVYTIWGKSAISDTIHVRDMSREGYPLTGRELEFHISPLSFYQVNPYQTEKLYSLALEYAGLTGQETVWDLYCGIGTISLFLAEKAKKVYGVEIVPQAIDDARDNAKRNGIANAEFFVGKAEEVLPKFYAGAKMVDTGENRIEGAGDAKMTEAVGAAGLSVNMGKVLGDSPGKGQTGSREKDRKENREMLHPDVIVVDPPRKGCDEVCLRTMLQMGPDRIVYVSCDSATLARDLKVLCDGGYEVKRIRGVDMFPQGVHVETVCLLSKLNVE